MACPFDRGLLTAHVDGEVTPAERAEAERHLASCAECRAEFEAIGAAVARVRKLPRVAAPPALVGRVLADIGPRFGAARLISGLGLVAAAILVTVVTWVYWPHPGAPKEPELAKVDRAPEPPGRQAADPAKGILKDAPAPAVPADERADSTEKAEGLKKAGPEMGLAAAEEAVLSLPGATGRAVVEKYLKSLKPTARAKAPEQAARELVLDLSEEELAGLLAALREAKVEPRRPADDAAKGEKEKAAEARGARMGKPAPAAAPAVSPGAPAAPRAEDADTKAPVRRRIRIVFEDPVPAAK